MSDEAAVDPALLRVEIDGETHEFPRDFELGEMRALKRLFGVAKFDDSLDVNDIDVIAGIAFLALRRASPATPDDELVRRVDAIKQLKITEAPEPEAASESADPTKPVVNDGPEPEAS